MNYFGNGGFVWFVHYHIHDGIKHSRCGWVDAHMDAFNWGGK